ncbi:hypothetical protein PPTG_04791 [Phytophthora nicotianae INRA-310]|uniref:Uncharacterized protein n=2 Tax=Phytophthora nicotianae TaxID=4792 RepID=W2R2B6_PHYN3|nr:hypothetical protein PPTG_04791 [Phytophthora nicotianae INRA-310]ETN19498.1 hypothetical protein PPTG_04791 [Phytophthora nicotianae INRA-310]
MLVILFAFYKALRQLKTVILFRKLKGTGFSMLYLNATTQQFWRKDRASFEDLHLVNDQSFELCLDGFVHDEIEQSFGILAQFRLLATGQYNLKNNDIPVLRRCLVPFWSKSDLIAIGEHFAWTEHDINEKYFYAGGNRRGFLLGEEVAKDSIDSAVRHVDLNGIQLLNTQYGLGSQVQIHRLRMASTGQSANLKKYYMSGSWFCVIKSVYALRKQAHIVTPTLLSGASRVLVSKPS